MAEYVELQIEAGATFSTQITVRDSNGVAINLQSYSARSQLRKSYYSTSAIDFVMQITSPADGIITMSLPAANTSNIKAGRYVYDVEIQDSSNTVTRIFEGIATVLPNVTR